MLNTRRLFQLISPTLKSTTTITRTRVAPASFHPRTGKHYLSTTSAWRSIAHDKKCWQCQSTNKPSALFCENTVCKVIQPIPAQLNFFHLLQAGKGDNKDQPTFDIDLKAMRRQFLMLQQKAHPDSFSQAPKRELDYAQLQSSVINKAYHTLKDPLSRAQYLLKEQGIQVNEGDSLSDPELLMEVMEFREELEEAQSEADIKPLKARNDEKYAETVHKLQLAFEENDYESAKDLAIELQYLNSIKTAILEWHQ
ncbi:co-chaperone Hsc20 [Mucor ambiguus]|uniref:Co-chaperone Hsc20 n=1 Tax=Mucor ambiguus TaxID=91626 RepID=A0A0C9LSA0_9FUNG|nr:co-chaperone Hsc20 [Mucor ambiguus]